MAGRVRERDNRRTVTAAATDYKGGAVLSRSSRGKAAATTRGGKGDKLRAAFPTAGGGKRGIPVHDADEDDSDSFQSVSESDDSEDDDQGTDGDSVDEDDDFESYDSYEDKRGRTVVKTARPGAQRTVTTAAVPGGQRVVRAPKQQKARSDKAIERAVERAASRAVDRAVQKAALETAKKVAAETARRTAAKVAGTRRRREESDEVVEVPAPRRQRRIGDADVYQGQMRMIRDVQVSNTQPHNVTGHYAPDGSWRDARSGVQQVSTQPAYQERRILRAPRVVYQDVSQMGGGPQRSPYGRPSMPRRPQPQGAVIEHKQVSTGQMRRFGQQSGPTVNPAVERQNREAASGRGALEQKLRSAIAQRQGMGTDEMCAELIQVVGGESGLVLGASYQFSPQASDALRQVCKQYMCRTSDPVPCVVVLQTLQGRYGATVFIDGVEGASDTGLRVDGSFEDPVLRALRNASAFADVRQKKQPGKKKGGLVETVTVDDDDDDIMDD